MPISYLSIGQGLTRDIFDEVTDADDLWLQSLETKKPHKKPRTREARPVATAIITALSWLNRCSSDFMADTEKESSLENLKYNFKAISDVVTQIFDILTFHL